MWFQNSKNSIKFLLLIDPKGELKKLVSQNLSQNSFCVVTPYCEAVCCYTKERGPLATIFHSTSQPQLQRSSPLNS
jgi:hypothetical protein